MANNNPNNNPDNVNINIDPQRTPVLYTDSVYIKANKNGVVLDFAQQLGPSNQYTVVSRIGMSKNHAEELVEHLEALLRQDGTRNTQKKD
jgi:hypothetical protein